jgi:hypothetical protein
VPVWNAVVQVQRRFEGYGRRDGRSAVVRGPGQLASAAAPPGKRTRAEPAAGLAGPTGQAPDPQPGPHTGQIGELSPPGGPSQRGQHCQARCERGRQCGGHRPGPQPQQAQAQSHQRQHRHAGTARIPGAAPARDTTGSPGGGAHDAKDEARAIPGTLRCLPLRGRAVPAIRWATTRPGGLAATECRAGPGRSARGPLPAPAVVHPATRTATAPSKAPARRDRAQAGQAVIAPPGMAPLLSLGRIAAGTGSTVHSLQASSSAWR